MADYRPYEIRRKAMEDEIAMKLAAEEAADRARWEKASQGVEAYNANLPGPDPLGYTRPQGQIIEPYQNFQLKVAKDRMELLQKQIDEAKAEEARQLALKAGETEIKKGEAETGKAEEETAGAKQTRGIIEDLRKAGVLGMDEGKLTTEAEPEKWSDTDKNQLNVLKADKGKIQTAIQKIDTNIYMRDEEKAAQKITLNTELTNIQSQMDELFTRNATQPLRTVPKAPAMEAGAPPVLYQNAEGRMVMTNIPQEGMPEDLRARVSGITGQPSGALPEGLTEDVIKENLDKYGARGVTRQDIIDRYKMMKPGNIPPVQGEVSPADMQKGMSFKQVPPYYTVGQGNEYKDNEGNVLAHDKYARKFIKFSKKNMRWESINGSQYYNGKKWVDIK